MADQLVESAQSVADGNGRCVVALGPFRAFERWRVTGVSNQNTGATNEPVFKIYKGNPSPSNLRGSSYSGRLDSGFGEEILLPGEKLTGEWTGADVGSQCILTLTGESFRQ